jgi:hypothetical protein
VARSTACAGCSPCRRAIGARSQHAHHVGDNLGGRTFLPVALVFPLPRLDAPLNVNQLPLFQVLLRDFSKLSPQHHPVPLRALLAFAGTVFESLVRRQSKIRHRLAAGSVAGFRITAESPNKNRFVNRHAREYITNFSVKLNGWPARSTTLASHCERDFDMIRPEDAYWLSGGGVVNKVQSFENHAKFLAPFHFFVAPILLINIGWSIYRVIHRFSAGSVIGLLVALALLALAFTARMMALTVQDRVIRLEMRLRMAQILPPDLRARVADFSTGQLVALRFASDSELPDLARKVLQDNVIDRTAIKKMIRDWQPDVLRA